MRREVLAPSIRVLFYSALILIFFFSLPATSAETLSSPKWSFRLDSKVRFYQTTDLGALVVGTEKSLYALDGESGELLWRRKNVQLDETDVAPVIGTDLLLLNFEKGGRTRLEAVDLLTGNPIWQSEKIKGSLMNIAVDLEHEMAAIVLARDAKGRAREGFKKRPMVYLINMTTGEEVWRYELESEVEMTPTRWSEDEDKETAYTLDNYRAPLFLDGRLYLFYEGVTSIDARTGKESISERFRVNEGGLALTESDPAVDEQNIYTSGRGRVRAISRLSGRTVWEAKDLGLTPEMVLTRGLLFVRTGGRFTRLKDGEISERGPYGMSAIDVTNGKILWRYKGADKGIANIALPDPSTVMIADRDEIVMIDAATGKPRARVKHRIERAAFVLINESGQAVVGGSSEIAAFDAKGDAKEFWRARHEPPGRGVLRTIGAVTARAASLYFRYGGVATTAFRGAQIVSGVSTLRWSGLATRFLLPNLTDFAAGAAREYVTSQFIPFGIASRVDLAGRTLQNVRSRQVRRMISIDVDVEEQLMDRLDPARQLERLSRFLWRRKQLVVLRGRHIYFYTQFKQEGERGLAGVDLNTGQTQRKIYLDDVDNRLTTDEVIEQLYLAKDDRVSAYRLGTQ